MVCPNECFNRTRNHAGDVCWHSLEAHRQRGSGSVKLLLEFREHHMTNQLTKRQHQVPQFYIKLWADSSNQMGADLLKQNRKGVGPYYFYQ